MLSRIKTIKMRLIGGIGATLPMQIFAINKGYDPKRIGEKPDPLNGDEMPLDAFKRLTSNDHAQG